MKRLLKKSNIIISVVAIVVTMSLSSCLTGLGLMLYALDEDDGHKNENSDSTVVKSFVDQMMKQ